MKNFTLIVLILMIAFPAGQALAFPKMPAVERFTNASCGPCATLNAAWYNQTVDDLETQGYLNHIVYNVNWPGPNDPMYLVNAADNMIRRGLYAVDSVPWIEVDGVTFVRTNNTETDRTNFTNAIMEAATNGYSPFQVEVVAERFAGDVFDIFVTVTRDPLDTTVFPGTLTLQVAVEEDVVTFDVPPGTNGETVFDDVSRKMAPDGVGSDLEVPAPGGSVVKSFVFIPSAELAAVMDFSQTRVMAFIQDDATDEIYQSTKVAAVFSDQVHAAFTTADDLGAAPLTVSFEDLSTPSSTTQIISWEWDLDGDGDIDSTEPEPTWVYPDPGLYTVSLTVSDGVDTHTITRPDFIRAVGHVADILVVNGIEYGTYPAEMETFYATSAIFGDHEVDVWDLFGTQGFNYAVNGDVRQVLELRRKVPDSVLRLYGTVIWVGNNYSGDLDYYDAGQVLSYLDDGGNFILATRQGTNFLSTALKTYCGINFVSGDRTMQQVVALDPNLVDMTAVGVQTLNHNVRFTATSEAVPLFRETVDPTLIVGFRIRKAGDGTFVYMSGRPYRWTSSQSYQNYDHILDAWMGDPAAVEEGVAASLRVSGAPNPFHGSTEIRFSLASPGPVSLRIYDAAGRLVRTLAAGPTTAGAHGVAWDGRNDAGLDVAAGVYSYRLEAGAQTSNGRLVLVK